MSSSDKIAVQNLKKKSSNKYMDIPFVHCFLYYVNNFPKLVLFLFDLRHVSFSSYYFVGLVMGYTSVI